MKTILFITYYFDKNTPVGVGAERIVKTLSDQGFRVFVITSGNNYNETIPNVQIVAKQNTPRLPSKFSTNMSNLFGKELYYAVWEIKAFYAAKHLLRKNQNIVAIYTRSSPISVCPVGARLKKKFHIPLLMHFTDPIPAPVEWYPNPKSRKTMVKQMRSLLPQADMISFGNQHMLYYEENVLKLSLRDKSFVSPDPGPQKFVFLPPKSDNQNTINLLFLGNIYGNRDPLCLFEAIRQLSNYRIRLFIYGDNKGSFPEFVILKDRTNDIMPVMQNADILVDIDGNDKTPVFISSKLKDYLTVNRPILSITPPNSPSRDLLNGLKTVEMSLNTPDNIRASLIKIIESNYSKNDYEERIPIVQSFSADKIANQIISQFSKICC